jgi:FAD-dependent urate hydroxylase
MSFDTDVAIVGAGPYGLSLAAHLRARRVNFRIFGEPMRFWRDLPDGINLKTPATSTNVFVPERGHTFPEWCRQRGLEDYEPCSMASFADYGLWMQRKFVPEIEHVKVAKISRDDDGFVTSLDNGETVRAKQVVVATGLSYLASVPAVLQHLPPGLLKHTSILSDFSQFKGKRVAIVGGGASAIEAGALVHEVGGKPEIFVREPHVVIYDRTPRKRSLGDRILRPSSPIGNGAVPFVVAQLPLFTYMLPDAKRLRLLNVFAPPSAPWWIKDRVVGIVPISTSHEIVAAREVQDCVRLTIRSKATRERDEDFDVVIAGTGYEKDVAKLAFLDTGIVDKIQTFEKAPILSMNFESSVQGLYFIGPMSELSFGPLSRFVAGASFSARTLTRHLRKQNLRRMPIINIPQRAFDRAT